MKNDILWKLNRVGEIRSSGLSDTVKKKFKPDTCFDHAAIAFFIMIFCGAVDFFVFRSLMSMISYDSPVMMMVQILGLLFGFDIVPIYLGIQLRRIRQGISRDRFLLIIALLAFAMAFTMNVALRLTTMDLLSPDLSAAALSGLGNPVAADTDAAAADPTAVSMTIYGICLPVVTSVGSFFISYLTYNPLLIRKKRLCALLEESGDRIRRYQAVIQELEADTDLKERLASYEEEKYQIALQEILIQAAQYCAYVMLRLEEYFKDPAATSALTREDCSQIFQRLNETITVLENQFSRDWLREYPKYDTAASASTKTVNLRRKTS